MTRMFVELMHTKREAQATYNKLKKQGWNEIDMEKDENMWRVSACKEEVKV